MKGLRIQQLDMAYPKEVALVQLLQKALFPNDAPVDPASSMWWAVREPGYRLVIGFAGLRVPFPDSPVTGYLSLCGVGRRWRGMGIQRALIRKRIAMARKLGVLRVVTDTYNNPASANNLIACGFRTYMPDAPWKADGAVYWFKDLT